MIIIFEGPDGSGKSTIKAHIADMLKANGIKVFEDGIKNIPTHPTKDPYRISEKDLYKELKLMANGDVVTLIDRGVISDIIYRLFDKYESVTTIGKFTKFLKQYGNKILIVYCNSSDPDRYDKMMKRGEDNPVAIEKYSLLSNIYELFFQQLEISVSPSIVRFDYARSKSFGEVYKTVETFVWFNK